MRPSSRPPYTSMRGRSFSEPLQRRTSREERPKREDKSKRNEKAKDEEGRDRGRTTRRRLSPEFLVFLATCLVVTILVSLLFSPLVLIDVVRIEGNQALSDEKILAQAGNPQGQNLFLYKAGQGEEALELDPYIDKAKISRQPLHGLLIQVQERAPMGILLDGKAYLHFAADGMLMDVSDSLQTTHLPIITGLSLESVPAPGEIIKDPTFHQALQITNACPPDLLVDLQEINISNPKQILAYSSQGIEIRLGQVDDTIKERLYSLQDILVQLVLLGDLPGPVDYIDIRYPGAPSIKMVGYEGPVAELNNLEAIQVPKEYQTVPETGSPVSEASG